MASEMGRRTAKRQIEETRKDLEEFIDAPHGEEQPMIDYLERSYGDEAEGYDYDDDWIDGE